MIEPSLGVCVVELDASNFGSIKLVEKTYDSITSGIILAVNEKNAMKYRGKAIPSKWIGCKGYWRAYKDDCRVKGPNGEKWALIEIKDIMGVENEPESTETTN